MSRGIRAVELALQLNTIDSRIRPSLSMDMKTEILDVEIFRRLQMNSFERIYRSTVDLKNEKEVDFLVGDLELMKEYLKEKKEKARTESDIAMEACIRG